MSISRKTKQESFTLILVHIFLCVEDDNRTWRCSNGNFKHNNCLNIKMQICGIYSLTSVCTQPKLAYYLDSVCIVYPPLNTMNDGRVNFLYF